MLVSIFLIILLFTLLAAIFIAPRFGEGSGLRRGSGPSSLKMDVINETNYNIASLDPGQAQSMTRPEAEAYLQKLRDQGKIPSYRDFYRLREIMADPKQ